MPSIRSLLVLCILCLSLGTTFAVFTADNFITGFQQQQSSLSLSEKKIYYTKVSNMLSGLALQNIDDQEESDLYTDLKDYVDDQLEALPQLSSWVVLVSWTSSSLMNLPHVDMTKVRTFWLDLHNTERKNKWLTPFTYSSALEWTATTWAKHLAASGKTRGLHLRKAWDGYYSYWSVKNRFEDQGITFAQKTPNFSENIGRNMYSCKKDDCTEDLIAAIKKSWNFFYSEKWKKYKPHYNAIVGNYTSLGLWVALVGNKYYLVSHYTQNLK